jgi:hypothetical protein
VSTASRATTVREEAGRLRKQTVDGSLPPAVSALAAPRTGAEALAVFDRAPDSDAFRDGDLALTALDVVTITRIDGRAWWQGEIADPEAPRGRRAGRVPLNYLDADDVRRIASSPEAPAAIRLAFATTAANSFGSARC